jgi:hypothetical protein
MTSAIGYASSSHTWLHFGLGGATAVPPIEVQWPSGSVQKVEAARLNGVVTVTETK